MLLPSYLPVAMEEGGEKEEQEQEKGGQEQEGQEQEQEDQEGQGQGKGPSEEGSFTEEWTERANDALQKGVTALYAKVLVILGVAFPLSEVFSDQVAPGFYQMFYVYLHLVSLLFLTFFWIDINFLQRAQELARRSRRGKIILKGQQTSSTTADCEEGVSDSSGPPLSVGQTLSDSTAGQTMSDSTAQTLSDSGGHMAGVLAAVRRISVRAPEHRTASPYGSFYLRLGTILFGIGSLIHYGLETGSIFEIESMEGGFHTCDSAVSMLRPVLQLLFIFSQMYFIFLNQKMNIYKRKFVSRLGLMHMLASNLCIWIKVVVMETEHEISSLEEGRNHSVSTSEGAPVHHNTRCGSSLMRKVLEDSSPFLFPCTIEFSLIAAAILFIMWKNVGLEHRHYKQVRTQFLVCQAARQSDTRSQAARQFSPLAPLGQQKKRQHYSVDCSHANTGMFCGIIVLVVTIISLIIFFVFISATNSREMRQVAAQVASLSEISLYSVTTVAVVVGRIQMRRLWYDCHRTLELDNLLLIIAQTGVFIYATFSVVATFFQFAEHMAAFFASLAILVQTILQTIFILDASCRFVTTEQEVTEKPGRQIVTFLLVCNLACWMMNTLETNRADSHPIQAEFFGGHLAWPIITHISMPLAIFYRFHSTVCLFEIWKKSFKYSKGSVMF